MKFSQKDIDHIHKEITAAEAKTSAEIVVVVSEKSDDYKYIPLLWGALLALILPLPLFYFSNLAATDIYLIQVSGFCLCAVILSLPLVIMHIVPRSLKNKRCGRRAMEQFLTQNLHTTKGRTGILIYVSDAEKYCEIIADEGIYEKLNKDYWREQVDILSQHISRGEVVEGFTEIIKENGKQLAKYYPAGAENENELPNHIILL